METRSATSGSCSAPAPFCRLKELYPFQPPKVVEPAGQRHGTPPVSFVLRIALPDDADPEAAHGASSRAASWHQRGRSGHVGDVCRDVGQARAEDARQAEQRRIDVITRQAGSLGHQAIDAADSW